MGFKVSIRGEYLHSQNPRIAGTLLEADLWHSTLSELPELGDVVLVVRDCYQVEKIELGVSSCHFILHVRPYEGSNVPVYHFTASDQRAISMLSDGVKSLYRRVLPSYCHTNHNYAVVAVNLKTTLLTCELSIDMKAISNGVVRTHSIVYSREFFNQVLEAANKIEYILNDELEQYSVDHSHFTLRTVKGHEVNIGNSQ